jgi:geranylgeranyl diphosphate synthase type II
MARESAEGQAIELEWIAGGRWHVRDREYVRMVHKKTGWYTFVAPMLAGATIAGADPRLASRLGRVAAMIGVGFQIQDDLLNLTGVEARTGKERMGDIWEGKHTLMLLHLLRTAPADEASRVRLILAKRRPPVALVGPLGASGSVSEAGEILRRLRLVLALQVRQGVVTAEVADAIERAAAEPEQNRYRTQDDVDEVFAFMERYHSLDHARAVAHRYARSAERELGRITADLPRSVHCDFLAAVANYVVERER